MRDQVCDVLRMDCVEHCVEVRSVRPAIFCILILHVLHDFWVRLELGENIVDSKLIELRHVDKFALTHFDKLLLTIENFAQEVSVCCRGRRNEVLHYKETSNIEQGLLTMVAQVGEQVLL